MAGIETFQLRLHSPFAGHPGTYGSPFRGIKENPILKVHASYIQGTKLRAEGRGSEAPFNEVISGYVGGTGSKIEQNFASGTDTVTYLPEVVKFE
jgi:hypothetical protein